MESAVSIIRAAIVRAVRLHRHGARKNRVPMSVSITPQSQSRGTGRFVRIKHILVREREALCGAMVAGIPPSPKADACTVCLDLSRRGYVGRV
jgi:hypothetical protein